MIKIDGFVLLPGYQTNTWLIWDDTALDALLIDPAAPDPDLERKLLTRGIKLWGIINTHGHGDHIGGNGFFKETFKCPIMIHEADAPMLTDNKKNLSEYMGTPLPLFPPDRILQDRDTIQMGEHQIKVIHTPGHTPGSISLLIEKFLISGDTLFEMSIGRTDFPSGSYSQIISSIKDKLFILPEDTIVFPGHGPRTSIGMEKQNNPFLR